MNALNDEVARIKNSGALGRSSPLVQLFDYLVEHAGDLRAPKETEIAHHVYGKSHDFDSSADAVVRVHVHRLRGKLDEFYRTHGEPACGKLVIPKGEYRLIMCQEHSTAGMLQKQHNLWQYAAIMLACVLLISFAWILTADGKRSDLAAENTKLWHAYSNSNQTTLVVVGDQYAFGIRDAQGQIRQIVQDDAIGSPEELAEYRMLHPEIARQFSNIDMHFLPVGAAGALHSILPVLSGNGSTARKVRVLPMSQITPDMLRATNVVYVGHLDGLGILGDPAFAGSRFTRSWMSNQLVERELNTASKNDDLANRNQRVAAAERGYISSFPGPTGNRITIISGTSDAGLMQAAETATNLSMLNSLLAKSKGIPNFEAVLDVRSLGMLNVGSTIKIVAPLNIAPIWRDPLPVEHP